MAAAVPSSEVQLARIARGGAVNMVGSLVAGVSGFVLAVVVTHGWDPDTAGTLFSATSLFLILTATGLLGTDTGLARFVLRYEAQGRTADISTVMRVALRPVVVVSLVMALVLGVFAEPIAALTGLPDRGAIVLRVLAVTLPLTVLSDACLAATRSFGNMRATVVADRLLRSGGQPVTILIASAIGLGLTGLSIAWALPYALAAIVAPLMLARIMRRRRSAKEQVHPARPASGIRREFWRYTWARGVARICQVALQRMDIILVAALRSPAEAALYTAATRFVILGQMGVMAIQQVLQPRLAQLMAAGEHDERDDRDERDERDDREAVHRVFTTSTAWIMAMSWPIYLTATVAAPLYLRLFGDRYHHQGQLVVILMGAGMLLAMAAGPVDVVLLMAGKSSLSLINNGAALVVDFALNLFLIPRYGINGAAAAWAIALGVRNLLPFLQVQRQLGLTGLSRATTIVAVASVACFAVPMLVLRVTAGLLVLPSLLVLAAATLAYAAILWRYRDTLELQALRRPRPRATPAEPPLA